MACAKEGSVNLTVSMAANSFKVNARSLLEAQPKIVAWTRLLKTPTSIQHLSCRISKLNDVDIILLHISANIFPAPLSVRTSTTAIDNRNNYRYLQGPLAECISRVRPPSRSVQSGSFADTVFFTTNDTIHLPNRQDASSTPRAISYPLFAYQHQVFTNATS